MTAPIHNVIRIHTEYDFPQRGQVETGDKGWIDWRKAKRLRRKGRLVSPAPYNKRLEAMQAALRFRLGKYVVMRADKTEYSRHKTLEDATASMATLSEVGMFLKVEGWP